MRTTQNQFGVPRLLIRILQTDRVAMSEKSITTLQGERKTLYLNSPWLTPTNKEGSAEVQENNDLSVRYGIVIGMSVGVGGYRKGDIAILDYTVDIDATYIVTYDKGDKIVSVPCVTTFCKEEVIATSYDKKYIERNVIVQKPGEVDQLSMVLGIIRGTKFIPNDHYLFCEPPLPTPQSLILFSGAASEQTHIQRKVLFAPKRCCIQPDQQIIAIKDSNMPLVVAGRPMEIIPVTDVLGYIEAEKIS